MTDIRIVATLPHQRQAAAWMKAGLARHGISVGITDQPTLAGGDVVICWGWRIGKRLRERGQTVLVMERGFVGDRMRWVSLGWNGLNGRAVRPPAEDGGARWERYHSGVLRPWVAEPRSLAVIMGQVPGDQSIRGINFDAWAKAEADHLTGRWRLGYRFHPQCKGVTSIPAGAEVLHGELDDALAVAGLVVTFNSNSGVDAVLAGIPTVAADEGSMAYAVTTRSAAETPIQPDRRAWAHRLAWAQWDPAEIEDGTAWEALRQCR